MLARSLLTILLCALPPFAQACSPSKSIDIYFSRNSAEVSAAQVLRLANWTATLKSRYPNRQGIYMSANAEAGEINAASLALARARNVERILAEGLQFTAPDFSPPTKGHIMPTGPDGSEDIKRVEIDFLPACPHECSCQLGDPLRDSLKPR